jgi:hypothetical protein
VANALELAEKIAAVKEEVDELAGRFASSKGQAEQLAAALGAIGADAAAQRFQAIAEKCEESESGRATLGGGLEKARWQVMSAVHGTLGPGKYGSGPGGRVVPQTQAGGADGGPKPGGLDAIPPHLRQDPTPTGEELTGVDSTIGPFQKEHENANTDQGMSPFRRGARSVIRNIGDLKDAADQLAKPTMTEMSTAWDPPETYPVVGTPEPLSTYTAPPQAHADYQNAVGNLVVVAALVAEVAARRIKHWKGQR